MLNVRMVKHNAKGAIGRGGHAARQGRGVFPRKAVAQGDTFLFSGKVLRFEGIRENECLVSQAFQLDPKIPSYNGGKFPLSTYLAERVRGMLADPGAARRPAGPGARLAVAAEGPVDAAEARTNC